MISTILFSFLALLFTCAPTSKEQTGGLKVGENAPVINQKSVTGSDVKWEELLKKGPIVVVFYRGSWCPFCNVYLASLVKELKTIQEYGTLIAITPQKPEKIEETTAKNEITFPVIFDQKGEIIRAYKAVSEKHNVPGSFSEQYENSILPVPATYIIGQDGKVTKVHFDENYKTRMDVKEVLAEMKRLARK